MPVILGTGPASTPDLPAVPDLSNPLDATAAANLPGAAAPLTNPNNNSSGGDASGAGDAVEVDGDAPCLNYAGYPTAGTLWAQYCAYLADLDDNNFMETSCR